ncbi:hypothetical protein A2U01_0061068, partial [Trifolium medium]|nr:hypothetical protein [Trifolium medium]
LPPHNLWTCKIRGGIFVEDNDDVLEKCEVSLIGLEEIGACLLLPRAVWASEKA